jgi:arsenate reductase
MSAGINPRPVNPKAIQVMKESGVDIQNQTSKKLDNAILEWSDLVVTTCDVSDEQCPLLPPKTAKLHWTIKNNKIDISNEKEVLRQVRLTSDLIRCYTSILLSKIDITE